MPAVYGYASVVMSRPWALASLMICSISRVRATLELLMWTTCSGAPVMSAPVMTSSSPVIPPRMCTCTDAWCRPATRNISRISHGVAAEV